MNDSELLRYSRHILLSPIDLAGQASFSAATVLAVGCGGLGSAALPLLAAAGVGRLLVVDDDIVELSNLQRQLAYDTHTIGSLKAQSMKQRLLAINPQIYCQAITKKIDECGLFTLMKGVDVVLDCSDNFPTRRIINRVALAYKIPLISAAAIRFTGQVAVYDFRQPESACYHCVFPDAEGNDGACSVSGVFSPLVAIMGSLQASECLKILANFGTGLAGKLSCYDAFTNQWQTFAIEKNHCCPVCSTKN